MKVRSTIFSPFFLVCVIKYFSNIAILFLLLTGSEHLWLRSLSYILHHAYLLSSYMQYDVMYTFEWGRMLSFRDDRDTSNPPHFNSSAVAIICGQPQSMNGFRQPDLPPPQTHKLYSHPLCDLFLLWLPEGDLQQRKKGRHCFLCFSWDKLATLLQSSYRLRNSTEASFTSKRSWFRCSVFVSGAGIVSS